MKKTVKLLLVNFIFIICIFLVMELTAYFIHSQGDVREIKLLYNLTTKEAVIETFNDFYNPKRYDRLYYSEHELRPPIIHNIPDNKEIVLYGCSFTHGYSLKDYENFSGVLSHYTDYNIKNFGLSGGGVREILYLLSAVKEPQKNTKYVIYTYFYHHKTRMYMNFRPKVPFYFHHKDKLVYLKYNPVFSSSLLFYCQYYLYSKYIYNTIKEDDLYLLYLKQINKLIKIKYPNADFVILVYNEPDYESERNKRIWEEMEKEGAIVIKTKDTIDVNLSDSEYKIVNDFHPNEKAWQTIVPVLAKKLDL